jgi:hypothetical protein
MDGMGGVNLTDRPGFVDLRGRARMDGWGVAFLSRGDPASAGRAAASGPLLRRGPPLTRDG